MSVSQSVVEYLRQNDLLLTTAESCTAICFAWAYQTGQGPCVFSRQLRFSGSRSEVQLLASEHALKLLPHFHQRALAGEQGQGARDER
jgi:nicotinamide mononucleotide (NMN) deamidase PncC